MKRYLHILLLTLGMLLVLSACTSNTTDVSAIASASDLSTSVEEFGSTTSPTVTRMGVALITDYNDISDLSINQAVYEACLAYSERNKINFNYYKPTMDSDEARLNMVQQAIDEGYTVLLLPGSTYAHLLIDIANNHPSVTVIGIDIDQAELSSSTLPGNLYCISYQEELCGYMAGYAAVILGYDKLGFIGSDSTDPKVIRYGLGFVQGVSDASSINMKTNVVIYYGYAEKTAGDDSLTEAMKSWYTDDIEVIFSCGGSIYTSVATAARKTGHKIIGSGVDQAAEINSDYGKKLTVTSAIKSYDKSIQTVLSQINDLTLATGCCQSFGLISETPKNNYVRLSEQTQFDSDFSTETYAALVSDLLNGRITVSNDTSDSPKSLAEGITMTYFDSVGLE